ncbi:MAG: calcium/sodium antiporter [Bacteroidaceae bacterium]|nr:calcium/sodium antiporter [Bacteroidaceae bacterium]
MTYIVLIISLVLLVVGANWLVDGAAAIARRYHMSEFIIGATIVGMGTSAPELVVSVISSIGGHGDIAIGNVVGSNIFNVLLILGITALLMPIKYTRDNVRRDIPLNIGVSLFVIVLCVLNKVGNGAYGLGRLSGILMLCLFAYYLWSSLRSGRDGQAAFDDAVETTTGYYRYTSVCVISIVAGLAGLIYGGNLFVDSASAIARQWGVSEAIIGLTIVAGGTSLPELVSSVIAVTKQKGQMALGNIVGSNIFNLLLILGTASTICPLTMGGITFVDWGVMLLSSLILLAAVYTFEKHTLDRKDALIFLLIYAGYMVWLF